MQFNQFKGVLPLNGFILMKYINHTVYMRANWFSGVIRPLHYGVDLVNLLFATTQWVFYTGT